MTIIDSNYGVSELHELLRSIESSDYKIPFI